MNQQSVSIAKTSDQKLDLDIICSPQDSRLIPVKEILDHIIDRIKELVESYTTTLVFVNTRNMTEIFVQRLKVAGLEGVEGHHDHGQVDPTRCRAETQGRWYRGKRLSSSSLEME